MQEAARNLGLQLFVLKAHIAGDIDTAFETLVRERAGALLVGTGALLTNRRKQIIALAERHAMPAIYPYREFTVDGGLFSYGNNVPDLFAKPASMPGVFSRATSQPIFRLSWVPISSSCSTVRLQRRLASRFSPLMFTRADEVIE